MKGYVFLSVMFLCSAGLCQQYSVPWSKFAARGSSTGQLYAVSGTVGQADAGLNMNGGKFSVTPGFWSFIAVVQTPGEPLVHIARVGNSVVVSWRSASSGLVLQQTLDLSAPAWVNSAFIVTDDGTNSSITIPSPSGKLFFRLARSQ